MVFGRSFLALQAWSLTPRARTSVIAAVVSITLSAVIFPTSGLGEPSSPRRVYAGDAYLSVVVSVDAEKTCGPHCAREAVAQFASTLREQIKLRVYESVNFGLNSETEPGILFVQIALGFNPEVGSGAIVLATEPALAPPARAVFPPAHFEASALYENGTLAPSLKDTLFKLAQTFAPYTSAKRRDYEQFGAMPHTGAAWNIVVRSDGDDTRITDTICAVAPGALAMQEHLNYPSRMTCVAELDDTSKKPVLIISTSKHGERIALYVEAIINMYAKMLDICPIPHIFASFDDFRENLHSTLEKCVSQPRR